MKLEKTTAYLHRDCNDSTEGGINHVKFMITIYVFLYDTGNLKQSMANIKALVET